MNNSSNSLLITAAIISILTFKCITKCFVPQACFTAAVDNSPVLWSDLINHHYNLFLF